MYYWQLNKSIMILSLTACTICIIGTLTILGVLALEDANK